MSGPRFDDDLDYWVDNPDEAEEFFHLDREYPPGFWPDDET